MSDLTVRPATDDDWPRIWPFFDAIVQAGETYAFPTGLTVETGRPWWMEQPPSYTLVAVDPEGAVLGSAKWGPNRPGRGAHVSTASFMVDPAARGRGAGRLLVEAVATWAAGTGAERLELCVTEANDPAVALYHTAGFEPTGGRDVLRPGSDVATVTLRRPLEVPPETVDGLVAEQVRYYEDRAPVYDELWHRQGRYDRGPEFNERWFRETAALEAAVPDTAGLRVLELAPGTGIWTRRLAPTAARVVAVDASPAMLARNLEAVADPRVEYVQADLFEWAPPDGETFDLIAFGFFLSHVPPDRFDAFWTRLRDWLTPGGRVWFCDDVAGPGRPYSGDTVEGVPIANTRSFDTDDEYRIVKIFWHPRDLASRLAELGWDAEVRATGEHFLVGEARPAPTPA